MKYIRVLALLLSLGLPAFAADSFPINVYPCSRAESAPALDGKLDDAAWQQAPVASGFTLFGTDKLSNPQTSFRLLWDDKFLYLGVHCDEPQMDKVRATHYAQDEQVIFSSETIEFFVDPNHTHNLYFQLAFNVAGSLFDGKENDSTAWNSSAQVITHLGQDFWSVEVAVPWEPLKARPQPGKIVGFNVNRNRNVADKTWDTWAQVMNGFHDPERFAHLVLSATPEMIGKLSPEFRQGGRTGPIIVYNTEGFAQASYVKLAEAAFAEVEKLLAGLDEERRKEKNPAVATEIERRLGEYTAKLNGLKRQNAGKLDNAVWTRLDIELQAIVVQISKTAGEARLKALLDRI